MRLRRALVCLLPLWAALPLGAAETRAPAPAPAAAPPVDTVIESVSAEAVSTATETTFTFRGNVTVAATNLKLSCDELVVVARRSGDAAATLGQQDNFKSLVATGRVLIVQGDREARCDRAAVYPGEDRVELTGNPVVRSLKEGWEQTGPKMILHRGQRRAVVEGTDAAPTRLVLPALKDLGDLGQDDRKKAAPAPAATPAPSVTVPLPPQPRP